MLKCSKCSLEKPLDKFHRGINKIGRRQPCAECRLVRNQPGYQPRIKPPWKCFTCGTMDNPWTKNLPNYCKSCWHKRYGKSSKPYWLSKRYGLSLFEYNLMREHQGGVCAICKRDGIRIVVDHCHTTKKVRGLLCDHCNAILGIWKDDPETAHRAFLYLNA